MEEAEEFVVGQEGQKKQIHYALSNSFAFAGNTASILVGAAENL